MNEAQLRDRLRELHDELETGPTVDDRTRALLREVVDDIEQLLATPTAERADAHESIAERLRERSWKLETSHPRLTTAVSQLVEALTRPFQ